MYADRPFHGERHLLKLNMFHASNVYTILSYE